MLRALRLRARQPYLTSSVKLFKQSSPRGSQFTGERKSLCRYVVMLSILSVVGCFVRAIGNYDSTQACKLYCMFAPTRCAFSEAE